MSQHEPLTPDESAVTRIEWEEFARGHVAPGEPPVRPRDAATIVVARQGPQGTALEVLLLQRPHTSRFAAGAYVFPGGVLEAGDGDPRLAARFPTAPTRAQLPAFAAAIRESFEETGALLSDIEPEPESAREVRHLLLADQLELEPALERLGARFEMLRAVYLARWITPVQLARRYDTRFFLAASAGHDPELTPEHTAWMWARPADALARFRAGELPMLFPTWKTLESLTGLDTLAGCLTRFAGRTVEPYLAKLDMRGERIRPLMPGDPEYDEV